MRPPRSHVATAFACAALLLSACRSEDDRSGTVERSDAVEPPVAAGGARADVLPPLRTHAAADSLIQKDERHFAHLWRLTDGVDNAAEGYWSHGGTALVYQATPRGTGCDRIYALDATNPMRPISDGRGVTTCAYFLPGDRE